MCGSDRKKNDRIRKNNDVENVVREPTTDANVMIYKIRITL